MVAKKQTRVKPKAVKSSVKTDNQQKKPHLFQPGQSGNPSGRKAGSRNKAPLLAQALIDDQGQEIVKACIREALDGDSACIKLLLDRLVGVRRDRPINLDLPEIRTAADTVAASGKIAEAVAMGDLTPSEGQVFSGVVEVHRRNLETQDIERRLRTLEEKEESK
jgi:hypothetical protein